MTVIVERRKHDFLRADERYVYEPGGGTVRVGEVKIHLPRRPDEGMMKSHLLRTKDQKYRKEKVPENIGNWPRWEIQEFAASQWHRRLNGEWHMINGKPYYIPGPCIPFFDFWILESGKPTEFRYPALELFYFFYLYVEKNKDIFGLYDLKTRRVGDTANLSYILWERTTRFEGVRGGLQSYTDEMAAKTFGRIAKGNRNMPFFFKPVNSGSDKEFLAFMPPNEVATMKKIRERDQLTETSLDQEFLGSYMDYQATVTGKYDGEQLFTAYMDEILKIEPHRMDAIAQYNNLKRVVSLFGESHIYGKILVSSTVEKKEGKEDIKSTIEVAEWFWENSDPAQMGENPDSRTNSGMVRIFRGYKAGAPLDEWGLPRLEEATKFRDARIKKALKLGDTALLHDIYRKEPGTAEEALIEDNENCPLYPEICQIRIRQIEEGLDKHNNPIPNYRQPYVEGIFKWKNDKPNSSVEFIPIKNGPWHISQHPDQPNNVQMQKILSRNSMGKLEEAITWVPMNSAIYRGGSDPISSNPKIITKGSKGSIVVKRRLYMPSESKGKLKISDDGIILNPEAMKTNQPVADYLHRPNSPNEFFDQIILACWYYGMPIMIEMDKPEAFAYLRERHYHGFIMYEPIPILQARGRKGVGYPGVRSQGDVVGMYVTRLQMYISNYWPAIKHPRLLKDASRFIVKNRTKHDHTVGWGMAELGDMDNRYSEEEADTGWKHNPFSD